MLYLAMVLLFVLQHLLQVQAVGQVAFSQVVAELRNTEQMLLHTHCVTVCKQEYTQEESDKTFGKEQKSVLKMLQAVLKCLQRGGNV